MAGAPSPPPPSTLRPLDFYLGKRSSVFSLFDSGLVLRYLILGHSYVPGNSYQAQVTVRAVHSTTRYYVCARALLAHRNPTTVPSHRNPTTTVVPSGAIGGAIINSSSTCLLVLGDTCDTCILPDTLLLYVAFPPLQSDVRHNHLW